MKECKKKEVAISGEMGTSNEIERAVSMAVSLHFILADRASVLIWSV